MNKNRPSGSFVIAFVWVWIFIPRILAQNFEILDQRLDANHHGYTVIRIWGTHQEMGFAMGAAFAEDIVTAWDEIKQEYSAVYSRARTAISKTAWPPSGIEEELSGLLEGVQSVNTTQMDLLDLKLLNSFSDLMYGACRSHSCWGSFVEEPVKTLSTRRLDFGTPFDMALHHVLCAWEPEDGSTRWVNLAWPGYVAVVTGVNEFGTLASLHDFESSAAWGDNRVTRSIATRLVLSDVPDLPPEGQLGWAEKALASYDVVTGTFLNYYSPEGAGGVFTCASGGSCGSARTPQAEYFNGEVLITTNSQTDGKTVPAGGTDMNDYYAAGGRKDLDSHFTLMGTTGLHLLSVEYRGRADMTLRFHGRELSDSVQVEWSELFPGKTPDGGPPDAGSEESSVDAGLETGIKEAGSDLGGVDPGSDANQADAGSEPHSGQESAHGGGEMDVEAIDQGGSGDGSQGCGCGPSGEPLSAWWNLLVLFLLIQRATINFRPRW